VGYLDFRIPLIGWRDDYANLAVLQEKLAQRASFMETLPA
jgi:glutathione S-transferase